MPTTAFVEVREAAHPNHICICGNSIGLGDQYKREAVPPWAFRYRDENGQLVDEGEGIWLVLKRCWDCMGGTSDALQSASQLGW